MNNEKQTTKYLSKLNNLKLSDSSRARIENNLLEYAKFHSVRVGEDSRSIKQVQRSTSLFTFKLAYMPFIILLTVMVGGGTSFAAQGALPGDFLYPVKTEINEPVRSVLAIGANAEANLQAKIVTERIAEAEELEAEGKLDSDARARLSASVQAHLAKAEKALEKSKDDVRDNTKSKIGLAIARFNVLVKNDTAFAIAMPGDGAEVVADTDTSLGLGTTLATRKMSPEALRTQTEARVTNLSKVVAKSKDKISTKVHAEFTTKLDTANKLIFHSKTQAEVESQQSLMKAAELAGEIESTISTMGTAEVDVNTGAIIDIDFDNVPPKEMEDNRTESDDSTESDEDYSSAADANIRLQLNEDGSNSVGGSAEAVINI